MTVGGEGEIDAVKADLLQEMVGLLEFKVRSCRSSAGTSVL